MKKRVLAVLLTVSMVFCNTSFLYAAEEGEVVSEEVSEQEEVREESSEKEIIEEKEESVQALEEPLQEEVTADDQDTLENDTVTGDAKDIVVDDFTEITSAEPVYFEKAEAVSEEKNVVDSGTCGPAAEWVLTGTDSELTLIISGSGMVDIYSDSIIPWSSKKSKIKKVIIEAGITAIGALEFSGYSNLTSITISDSVISIIAYDFSGCSSLTSITIPDCVTYIGGYAFENCSNLTNISIPDSVTSIGVGAFKGCSSLTSITIPDAVTSIGEYAFSECSSLTSITIPDSVTSIGEYAFSWCSSLTSITIPDSVTSIGEYAFSWCSSLTSITIPDGVTNIGEFAFSGCSSLTSITIPDSVTSIKTGTFDRCSSLTNITIPDGVTSIADRFFYDCSSLTSITIPDGVNNIGESAFSGCSSLTTITIPDSVTSIKGGAFDRCSSLTSITIPDGVTDIGGGTFSGCSGLTSIRIPDGVADIGVGTFCGCSSLTSITIPDSVTSIGDCAFQACISLTSITIPDSVTNFGDSSFSACSSLTSITIPDSVTSIGGGVFYGCSSLTSIAIPDSVTSIGNEFFWDCIKLTSITIPDTVTSIGWRAFSGCSSLTSITIPDGVTSIGNYAFQGCSSLASIMIPDGVTSIGEYAFSECSSLTSIAIPDSITSIEGYVCFECSSLTSITIPDGVTDIGECAFSGCSSLTTITIPDSVTSIKGGVFDRCRSLTSITIPDSVTSIWDSTFTGCRSLISIMIPDSVTYISRYAFSSYYPIMTLLVHSGSYAEEYAQNNNLSYKIVCKNHTWEEDYTVDKEATCAVEGSESIHCSVCGSIDGDTVRVIPKKDHHTFGEWTIISEPTATEPGIEERACTLCGEKEQREYWEGYDITYILNGGTNHAENPNSYYIKATITLKNPLKIGYTFSGWYSDAKFKKKVTTVSGGDKTVYAKWTVNKYNIAFNGNGSTSGKMSKMSGIAYDASKTLTGNAFKRTGYNFIGWNTEKDGSGTSYTNKQTIAKLSETNGATITLYAQWEIIPYTITYNLGSGDAVNAEANPTSYDVTTAVTLQAPTRPFSTFQGWYSDAKLKNKVTAIKKGSTGNKTFYAKWTTNKYTITFKGNGSASGKMKDLTGIVYNADKTLTANAFKRTGYHFVEWNTAADGSGDSYANKQVVNGLSTENGVKVALYAIWEKDIYIITYNLNGADAVNAEANPATYDVEMTVNLEAPTREHYTFSGWYSDKKLKKKVTVIKKGSTGNRTFFAKWTPNKYNIAYNGNGSTGGKMKNTTGVEYGKSKALAGNAYSRKGYKFTGWNTEADGSGTAYANKASVRNLAEDNGVTVTLYAQWELETYKITYSMGSNAVNAEANPADYTIVTETITLEEPARPGYIFGGWYSDSKLKKKATGIATGSTGNKTFYAKWTPIKYTIVFDGNGATSGSMAKISNVSYGTSKTLAGNGFKKTGAAFLGWSLTPDGEVKYKNKTKGVKDLTTENGATVTLYAVWSN